MYISSLKVFCDIVEAGSFTAAGQKNGITQSAVSQIIATLELHFRHQLIERPRRAAQLTREGRVVYEHSRQIVDRAAELDRKMEEVKQSVAGDIHLATVPSLGLHDLACRLEKFGKLFPAVKVHVVYRCDDAVYEAVAGNEVDLGLVAFPRIAGNLRSIPLYDDPLVLICSPEHPLAHRRRIDLKDLAGQTLVTCEAEIPLRLVIDKVLRAAGVTIESAIELQNIEMAKRAVEIGAGIAIVPQRMVKTEVTDRTLSAASLKGADLCCSWAAIHQSDKVISPALRELIGMLKTES